MVGVLLLDEHDDLVERSGGPSWQPVERVLNDLVEVGLIHGSQRRGGVAEGASRWRCHGREDRADATTARM